MKKFVPIFVLPFVIAVFTSCEETVNKPNACFTPTKTTAQVNDLISFNDCSTDADTYLWDFGDGNSSTDISPVHAFDESGQFVVKLIVTNKGGEDVTNSIIEIEDIMPVACFTYTPSGTVYSGEEVSFTNCTTDAESYTWDFDDGTTSVAGNPKHIFTESGEFNVKLTAKNHSLQNEIIHTITVLPNVEACFTISPNPAYVGENITFTNCSVNATSYDWDIDGNGTIDSHDANPIFSFNVAGTFSVKLIARNGSSYNEAIHQIVINENTSSVTACFTMDPNPGTINVPVYFTNCSSGATSYGWDFNNDGAIDADFENPIVTFQQAGTYTIKLIAYSASSNNSVTHQLVIGSGDIDPTLYDIPVGWAEYYNNEFDASGDWTVGSNSDYNAVISGGFYSVTNLHAEYSYFFWTNAIGMPATTEDYDYEVYFKIEYDNVTQGDGIFSSFNETSFDHYFFKLAPSGGTSYYTYGNKNNDPWATGFYGTGGNYGEYNKLTIRKYENDVYYFLNEDFINTLPFEGNYGDYFGFLIGADSKITVDWIAIWNVDSGTPNSKGGKLFTVNKSLSKNNIGKTFTAKKRSQQTGNQVKKIPLKLPTLK